MRHRSLLTAAALALTACGSAPTRSPPPANLLAPCADIPDTRPTDLGELLEADVELIGLYADCAARHSALAQWAR